MCGQFSFVSRRSFAPPPCPARTWPRPPSGGHSVVSLLRRASMVTAAGRQPCRCLCLGSVQMTMTRPCRRMIRHLLQIFLTLGLTFTVLSPLNLILLVCLLVPVHDPPATEVVGTELYDHAVVRQDADVVHPHFPADVSENLVPVVQLHPEEGIRERLDNRALNLNGAVFLGHVLRASLYGDGPRLGAVWSGVTVPTLLG